MEEFSICRFDLSCDKVKLSVCAIGSQVVSGLRMQAKLMTVHDTIKNHQVK